MGVILLLILASLGLAVCFLCLFMWAVRSGQYEDTCTPSLRVLTDEGVPVEAVPSVGGISVKNPNEKRP